MSLSSVCAGSRISVVGSVVVFFFFNDTATTEIYTLSLHDALPIYVAWGSMSRGVAIPGSITQIQGVPIQGV